METDELIREEIDEETGTKKIILDMDLLKEQLGRRRVISVEDSNLGIKIDLLSDKETPKQLMSLALNSFDKILLKRKSKSSGYIG